jgi:hypothetical protein
MSTFVPAPDQSRLDRNPASFLQLKMDCDAQLPLILRFGTNASSGAVWGVEVRY